jgi:signal transduction histidine kinase
VWVEIADNGGGIAKEHLARIFDPFFTTKPIGSGTGLGLSLSYGIIQKHNGQIEVHSEPGQGTTFRIVLPIHHSPGAGEAPRS